MGILDSLKSFFSGSKPTTDQPQEPQEQPAGQPTGKEAQSTEPQQTEEDKEGETPVQ